MKLKRVTITGIDTTTNLQRLCSLSDQFPFSEWAFLLSKKREGLEPRYPPSVWINAALANIDDDVKLAGHLCGEWAREAVGSSFIWAINWNKQFKRFGRIQINESGVTGSTVKAVDRLAEETAKTFILQVPHWNSWSGGNPKGVHFLIDNSGGRGKPLEYFQCPPKGINGGFSGGIGPDNIRGILERLTAIESDAEFWIDMESGVRTDDGFDLDKAQKCLEIASGFVEASA